MAKERGTIVECLENAVDSLTGNWAYGENCIREDENDKLQRVGNEMREVHAILVQLVEAIKNSNLQAASRLIKTQIEFGFEP